MTTFVVSLYVSFRFTHLQFEETHGLIMIKRLQFIAYQLEEAVPLFHYTILLYNDRSHMLTGAITVADFSHTLSASTTYHLPYVKTVQKPAPFLVLPAV